MKQPLVRSIALAGLGLFCFSLPRTHAKDAVPVGEHAVPVGEDAVPVGEDAVPVGEHAVPIGEGAVPIGEGAVPVGENAVPVGEGAVPVGEDARPVGEDAKPVGENARPVGEDAKPVGEDAQPVGEDAVPVGEYAVPVGEDTVPVGEEARPVGESRWRSRLKSRAASANHPKLGHLFKGEKSDRWPAAEKRFHDAIRHVHPLGSAFLAKRKSANAEWAAGALKRAESRPDGLFEEAWWKQCEGRLGDAAPAYFTARPAAEWWNAPDWKTIAKTAGLPASTKPFLYIYDGNLTFKNDVIHVNGQPVAAYEDFVSSALRLAKSGNPGATEEAGWTPLGTFLFSTNSKTKSAPHAVQLAMDKDGNISGLYANWPGGAVIPVHGKLDPETQRVAFEIGHDNRVVLETGLENLTKPATRFWVHLPNMHSQTWLAIRMTPETGKSNGTQK